MKLYIPNKNDKQEEQILNISINEQNGNGKQTLKVNINTATNEELQKLPGIGETMANRIVTYRKQNGKFSKLEDLKNVSGIGEAKFNNIKNYIYIK